MRPSIAIVGASARAAAASAVRAGFQPITADLFADADLRAIATATRISPYPEGLLDWLRAVEPPAWIYTGALENHPELIDQLAWIAPLWGNPGDVLTRVRSPWQLAKTLGDAGLLFPETLESADGLPRDGSWLAKTYQGASGSDVRELGREQGATQAVLGSEQEVFADVPNWKSTACFQRRIDGLPCSAVFVAMDDTAVLVGVTRQLIGTTWLGAHGFQYAGSVGLLPVPGATQEKVAQIGEVLTKRFELNGLFGVDFILDRDQVWTLEVNPRYTASVEICERATGQNTITSSVVDWPDSPLNRLTAFTPVPQVTYGKAIMFAKRHIVISEAFAEMALAEALRKPWPTLADVSSAGTSVEMGRPILTVFANGATADEVERQLRIRVEELERQLYGSEVPS